MKPASPLKDLFALFPDLPRLPMRSSKEGVRRVRLKAELVRQTVAANTIARRAAVDRVIAAMHRRTVATALGPAKRRSSRR